MINKLLRLLLVFSALMGSATCGTESTVEPFLLGRVIKVVDGDTIHVLVDQTPIRVRLLDIDAPERGQAYANRARQALADMVFGQPVTVHTQGKDIYGRVLGTVFISQTDINAELIKEGYVWVYHPSKQKAAYVRLEAEARATRRGLWADRNPTPPWKFRTSRR